MKKIEKSIKDAKKTVAKFSKGKQYESNEIKAFVESLDAKTKELVVDVSEIIALKNSIKDKKKKADKKKAEIKDFINGLNKLARTQSKELLKRKLAEKELEKSKEKSASKEAKSQPATKTPAKKRAPRRKVVNATKPLENK